MITITIPLEEVMPIGSVWGYKSNHTRVVHTVIAFDEGKAIVRCNDLTRGDGQPIPESDRRPGDHTPGIIYRAVDEHEYSTWVSKMYDRLQ